MAIPSQRCPWNMPGWETPTVATTHWPPLHYLCTQVSMIAQVQTATHNAVVSGRVARGAPGDVYLCKYQIDTT